MNEQNLIPYDKLTEEQQREFVRKGGKRSGEVRKQKAELKKLFMQFANMKPTEKESKQLEAMGFDNKDLTNMTSYVVSLFKNGAKGNSKAMEIGVDLMMNYNKRELENEKLKEEIEKLKLEQEKLKQELEGYNKESQTQIIINGFRELPEDTID